MSEITPEKTHVLLEKLADYVMGKIPNIETNLQQKAEKNDLERLEKRVNTIDDKMNLLLEGMDAQSKQLETLSIDMKTVSGTLDIHKERLAILEERVFGARVREDQEQYKDKNPD